MFVMSDSMAVSRRLVAVFAADVEGYSRLMGVDEVGTLKGLTERRAILDRLIGEHGSRIANTAGEVFNFRMAETARDCLFRAFQIADLGIFGDPNALNQLATFLRGDVTVLWF